VKHSDFISPEYQTLEKINPKKWEDAEASAVVWLQSREGEAENDCTG